MASLLIKNGYVVTERDEAARDVLVSGETITKIGEAGENLVPVDPDTAVIDAAGKIVIPGGIDAHTHLGLDVGFTTASDDFFTGTVAAAHGGVTAIVDHPAFGPAGCPLCHQIERYLRLAEGNAVIDYGFHGVIQHVDDAVLDAMPALAADGITSYKVYLTYDYKIEDGGLYRVLEKAGAENLLITVHPENDGVINHLRRMFVAAEKTAPRYHPLSRPVECEAEAINRMILFARMTGDAPLYIVHLTNGLGLDFIRAARERGQQNLYAETCPQYLLLDESRYDLPGDEGLKYIMCPPLRTKADQEALWAGLARGDIDVIATDHCPFFFATQKKRGSGDFTRTPSGAPGVEERLTLIYSEGVVKNRLTLRQFVNLNSTNPAKLFGLYPRKGVLQKGSDADIVILDPSARTVLSTKNSHSNVDYTAYEGFAVIGRPVTTIARGEVIVQNGVFKGAKGRGRFLKREKRQGINA
ncbi:MAG: dihydropyrimidinase [Spirochaetaceae bacterium]|jgi:dihydropyrimidinase|nr:dihydropyrimidinase [Spirochaetaceae bacterium]